MGSVTTAAWARHAEQLVVEPRCRSASLSIGYAMAIHKPMAVGGTRVSRQWDACGPICGRAVVAAESVYTEAVGRTFGWLERVRQARRVDRGAARRPEVRPRGGVPGGAT